jgi:inosine-uridine nucleoside N-ribohydrolase
LTGAGEKPHRFAGSQTDIDERKRLEEQMMHMALHDPLAVAVAIDPSLVKWEAVRLAVGPDGETQRAGGAPNCRVAKGVDRDRFIRLFLDRLCPVTPERGASS